MAVPDWVSYVSLAGGIVGTISGCLGYRLRGDAALSALGDLRAQVAHSVDRHLQGLRAGSYLFINYWRKRAKSDGRPVENYFGQKTQNFRLSM